MWKSSSVVGSCALQQQELSRECLTANFVMIEPGGDVVTRLIPHHKESQSFI